MQAQPLTSKTRTLALAGTFLIALLCLIVPNAGADTEWGVKCGDGSPHVDFGGGLPLVNQRVTIPGNGFTLVPPTSVSSSATSKTGEKINATYRWQHIATLITQDGSGTLDFTSTSQTSHSSSVTNSFGASLGFSVSAGADVGFASMSTKITAAFDYDTSTTKSNLVSSGRTFDQSFEIKAGAASQLWQLVVDYEAESTKVRYTVATGHTLECHYKIDFSAEPKIYVQQDKPMDFPTSPKIVDGTTCFYTGRDKKPNCKGGPPSPVRLIGNIGVSKSEVDMISAFRHRFTQYDMQLNLKSCSGAGGSLTRETGYWTNLLFDRLARCNWQGVFSDNTSPFVTWAMFDCDTCRGDSKALCEVYVKPSMSSALAKKCAESNSLSSGWCRTFYVSATYEDFVNDTCLDFQTIAAGGEPAWLQQSQKSTRKTINPDITVSWVNTQTRGAADSGGIDVIFSTSSKTSVEEEKSFSASVGIDVEASGNFDGATVGATMSASVRVGKSSSWGLSAGSATQKGYHIQNLESSDVAVWELDVLYSNKAEDGKKYHWSPPSNIVMVLANQPR